MRTRLVAAAAEGIGHGIDFSSQIHKSDKWRGGGGRELHIILLYSLKTLYSSTATRLVFHSTWFSASRPPPRRHHPISPTIFNPRLTWSSPSSSAVEGHEGRKQSLLSPTP